MTETPENHFISSDNKNVCDILGATIQKAEMASLPQFKNIYKAELTFQAIVKEKMSNDY